MFLLNAVRIALLVYVGTNISREVSLTGFHADFGILSLFIVMIVA
jgi:hypothetical protein